MNYNYEPCEVSSSLLHVVCLAAIHYLLQIDMYVIGRFFGIALGLATLLFGMMKSVDLLSSAFFALFLLSDQAFLYWSFGGLETSLASFLMLGYCLCLAKSLNTGSFRITSLFGLRFISSRPEGFIVILISISTWFLYRFLDKARLPRWYLASTCVIITHFVALTLFRYLEFGFFFPCPVYAKTELSQDFLIQGLEYLQKLASRPYAVVSVLVPLVFLLYEFARSLYKRTLNPSVTVIFLAVVGYICFCLLSGGDWMEYGRFLVPVMPALAFGGAQVIAQYLGRRSRRGVTLALVFLLLSMPYTLSFVSSEPGNASSRVSVRDFEPTVRWLMLLNEPHKRDILVSCHT